MLAGRSVTQVSCGDNFTVIATNGELIHSFFEHLISCSAPKANENIRHWSEHHDNMVITRKRVKQCCQIFQKIKKIIAFTSSHETIVCWEDIGYFHYESFILWLRMDSYDGSPTVITLLISNILRRIIQLEHTTFKLCEASCRTRAENDHYSQNIITVNINIFITNLQTIRYLLAVAVPREG